MLPANNVPEAVVGPEMLNSPMFEMLAVAVMKLFELENVAVFCNDLDVDDVAAVIAARTTEPEPLVETSPLSVVAAAAGAVPVPSAAKATYAEPEIEPSELTIKELNPKLVIWFSCQPESPTICPSSSMWTRNMPRTLVLSCAVDLLIYLIPLYLLNQLLYYLSIMR